MNLKLVIPPPAGLQSGQHVGSLVLEVGRPPGLVRKRLPEGDGERIKAMERQAILEKSQVREAKAGVKALAKRFGAGMVSMSTELSTTGEENQPQHFNFAEAGCRMPTNEEGDPLCREMQDVGFGIAAQLPVQDWQSDGSVFGALTADKGTSCHICGTMIQKFGMGRHLKTCGNGKQPAIKTPCPRCGKLVGEGKGQHEKACGKEKRQANHIPCENKSESSFDPGSGLKAPLTSPSSSSVIKKQKVKLPRRPCEKRTCDRCLRLIGITGWKRHRDACPPKSQP
jgi:hypothetical protein